MSPNPHIPDSLPPTIEWSALVPLIARANAALARYDGLLQSMVNPGVLLSPLTLQEAVLSSRIEGTEATLSEVLQHEAGKVFEERKEQDIREIINYRRALLLAEEILQKKPISLNLIKELHSVLLSGTRGKDKTPGEFRRIQNWIGPPNTPLEKATFIPPDPATMKSALDNWEKYIHKEERNVIVQLAIVHAQFEIIHPFLDGNGRIGRILIPIFLYEKGVLVRPMFYLSAYLEENRNQYYDSLRDISGKNNWHGWIEFFLTAVQTQAEENIQKVRAIQELYEEMKRKIVEITRSQYALATLDGIFSKPILGTIDFVNLMGIPSATAKRIVNLLVESGILVELQEAKGRRRAVLAFPKLLNISEGKEIIPIQ